ncbi:hypothetical protein C5167_041367 [Papaver somniferum]|nr:hypothetical protein C5167_041367 [Papaver somniferum]
MVLSWHFHLFETVSIDEPAPGLKAIFNFVVPDQRFGKGILETRVFPGGNHTAESGGWDYGRSRWAVGVASNSSTSPEYCWQIPEDLDHVPVYGAKSVEPDLAGQMAAALGAASILFTNDNAYSAKIVDDAEVLSKFASAPGNHHPYSFVRALLRYGITESTAVRTCGLNIKYLRNYTSVELLAPNMQAKVVHWDTASCCSQAKVVNYGFMDLAS